MYYDIPRDITQLKYIVLHHTATRDDLTAQQMEQSMKNTYKVVVPTHYIIDKRGSVVRPNNWDKNVGAVSKDNYNTNKDVEDANLYGIHIELVGNFNNHPPTEAQYERLNILINQIQNRAKAEGIKNQLIIKDHSDFASKICPGKLFDHKRLKDPITKRRITQYTPCTTEGSDINDSESNGGSCDITAAGLPLLNEYAGKMGACPPEFTIGKNGNPRQILQIEDNEGIRHDFECVDRGSAITGKHLDLFVGLGLFGDANYKEGTFASLVGYRNVRVKQ